MIIRNCPITPQRGNEHIAQGNALGSMTSDTRPARAKALFPAWAFALAGRRWCASYTQGAALGYALTALSGHQSSDKSVFNTKVTTQI